MASTYAEIANSSPAQPAGTLNLLPGNAEGAYSVETGTAMAESELQADAEAGQAEVVDAIRRCIDDFELDLGERVVVTGAGAGFEAITAIAAVLAGARGVFALSTERKKHARTPATPWDARDLATQAGRSDRLEIMRRMNPQDWQKVDILVSCPQIRPISRSIIELLRPNSVVALMAEPWELRPEMVDLSACGDMQVKVVAPNLEHPSIDMLPELARLCCRLLDDAGIRACSANIALLCDTPCRPHIESALTGLGARVSVFPSPEMLLPDAWDAIVVALRPAAKSSMDIHGLARVFDKARETLLVQFSGEIDRLAARYFGLRVWPPRKPGRGQLGLPLEVLGWHPVVRRLVGGLKAAETALRGVDLRQDGIGFVVNP